MFYPLSHKLEISTKAYPKPLCFILSQSANAGIVHELKAELNKRIENGMTILTSSCNNNLFYASYVVINKIIVSTLKHLSLLILIFVNYSKKNRINSNLYLTL